MASTSKPNRQRREGNRDMRDTAIRMELLLSRLTLEHEGKPLGDIKPKLRSAFQREGWDITGRELTQWATMISQGKKINIFFEPV